MRRGAGTGGRDARRLVEAVPGSGLGRVAAGGLAGGAPGLVRASLPLRRALTRTGRAPRLHAPPREAA